MFFYQLFVFCEKWWLKKTHKKIKPATEYQIKRCSWACRNQYFTQTIFCLMVHQEHQQIFPNRGVPRDTPSQPAHNIEATLYGRWNDVKTLKRRRNNVVLTSCADNIRLNSFLGFSQWHLLCLLHSFIAMKKIMNQVSIWTMTYAHGRVTRFIVWLRKNTVKSLI